MECSSVTLEDTYINQLAVIALSQIMKDASFVQVCEVGHVFNLLELRWIHLANQILLQRLILLTYSTVGHKILSSIDSYVTQPPRY